MRILHLINALEPGGIETWLLRMLTALPRKHVAMDFCCKGNGTGSLADEARRLGASVIHCPLRLSHTEFVGGIVRTLRNGGYDIVHNHLDVTSGPAVWAANMVSVPTITSFHNTHFAPQTWTRSPGIRQLRELYSRFSIGYSLKHSAAITGCSQAVLDAVVPENADDPRCHTLYYGVETHPRANHSDRAAFRRSIDVSEESPIVLHVGRFYSQKNHPGLLRIFRQVCGEMPTATLVLVGDGPARPEIESQISELGISDNVRVLGRRNDVSRIMMASDAFLFPSFHEGLPVVSLEACACQLPLVGSRIPGTTESIVDGETGFLHAVEDESAMAASVLRLLNEPETAERIRRAANERIENYFSRSASAASLKQLYATVVVQQRRRRSA